MKLDLRIPIGIIFSIFGVILVVYSKISDPAVYEKHSLGININFEWGLVMLVFGILMLVPAMIWRKK